ncbi:MAG: RtcB family protein [Polyangiaceae bacterium]
MSASVLFEPERGQRVPVLVWRRDLAPQTARQLQSLASQPWAVDHVAAMPDAHVAEGVAVGTVFATERELVPSALGGDLGCGMSAMRLTADASSLGPRELSLLLQSLAKKIPVGDATHRGKGQSLPEHLETLPASSGVISHALERTGPRHLGTLGGGNHFIELDRDAGGGLWLLLHTGSRGIGAAIHGHHRKAAGANEQTPLAALDIEQPNGAAYLRDLTLAYAFAESESRLDLHGCRRGHARPLRHVVR